MEAQWNPEHCTFDWEKRQSLIATFPDRMDMAPPRDWQKLPPQKDVDWKDRILEKMLLFDAPIPMMAPAVVLLLPFDKIWELNARTF